MAKENFDRCLRFTLTYEGGFVSHPADPGGATNLGITKRVLEGWRGHPLTVADVKALGRAEAAAIYRANYWNTVHGDDLPLGIDLVVWDYAVNSGPSRGVKALQKALGVKVDGFMGPATKGAARKADPVAVVEAVCKERQAFVRSLKTYKHFGKGWERRINAVRSLGLKMTAPNADPTVDMAEAPQPKADPRDKSIATSTTAAGGAIAGAGGAIAAGKEAIDMAKDAASTAKDGWQVLASMGPWILLLIVILAAAGYIIWERRRRAREEGE